MLEAREYSPFPQEPADILQRGQLRLEQLESHPLADIRPLGEEDMAHPAAPDQADQPVAANLPPLDDPIGQHARERFRRGPFEESARIRTRVGVQQLAQLVREAGVFARQAIQEHLARGATEVRGFAKRVFEPASATHAADPHFRQRDDDSRDGSREESRTASRSRWDAEILRGLPVPGDSGRSARSSQARAKRQPSDTVV